MKMFLVRHGEAGSNVGPLDRLVGAHADLTERGREQVEATARRLGGMVTTKTVYSSPIPRAKESAALIATTLGRDAEVVIDERLKEIDKGNWKGRPISEVMEMEAEVDVDERHLFRPPGGENWPDVGERVADFIEERRLSGCQEALAVSHDHPIRMGIGKLLGKPVVTWEGMPIDYASITILEYLDGKWVISHAVSHHKSE